MIRYRTIRGKLCQIVMCLLIFLASCKSPGIRTEDLSAFYLPVGSFPAEGITYTYRNILDTTAEDEVWHHQLTSKDHITSINYNNRQQVVQKQYEKIVSNGVLIDSLSLYFSDEHQGVQSIPVRVLSANRFPFDAIDSSRLWVTKLEWWQPGDSLHVILERRRRFLGHTTFSFEGKPLEAIRFRTEDKFETEEVGWTTSEWTGEEWYARNIGLVYYKRNISDQLHLAFELERRTPAR